MSDAVLNAFTVDVEDYFQVSGFERNIPRSSWPEYESRVAESTTRLLDLLDRKQVRGTFFILGWIAERFPKLVRDIARRGHEIGSHSYWHRLIYELSPREFRDDLRTARTAIEDAASVAVRSFRAPSFSITQKSLWALDVLADEGYTVDSSIVPARHDRYGIADAPREIHARDTSSGTVCEFPPTVAEVAGFRVPIGGGGYFRLYPWALSRRLLAAANQLGQPFMFYVHPWEIDPEQPRLRAGSTSSRWRHYVNLHSTFSKLERLLDTFRFGTMSESIAQRQSAAPLTPMRVAA